MPAQLQSLQPDRFCVVSLNIGGRNTNPLEFVMDGDDSDVGSCYYLGQQYLSVTPYGPRNPPKAQTCLATACNLGHAPSCRLLFHIGAPSHRTRVSGVPAEQPVHSGARAADWSETEARSKLARAWAVVASPGWEPCCRVLRRSAAAAALGRAAALSPLRATARACECAPPPACAPLRPEGELCPDMT